MLNRLSEPQIRTVGFIAGPVIVTASTLLAYTIGSYYLAIIAAVVATISVAILSRALTPPWFGRSRSQIYSLAVLSGTALVVLSPDTIWLPIAESLFLQLGLQPPSVPDLWQRAVVLTIFAVAIILLNFIWSRQQIIPPSDISPKEADTEFNTLGYVTLRNEFCTYMVTQLDQYDRDVHWSDSDYRSLEAEVEIDRQGTKRPKVARDLVKAIHDDRTSRAFLLLGDPGSGKSVSLRRLCRELYTQVHRTGIVPVYVNLREWTGPAEPTDEDISNFLLQHLKLQSGRAGIRFLETWFAPMLDRGLFFLIFDSFDEMHAVLDCDDASKRLQTISGAFNRFFNDLHQCRGVLSSRLFRQPRGFRGRRLTIRPFSEIQVHGAMKRWLLGQPVDADQILRQLFREKPEFSSIVSNPFSADLVAQFLSNNPGRFPDSYFSVFEDHVSRRLNEDAAGLRELELNPAEVLDGATRIAWAMYQSEEVGLDVEARTLHRLIEDPKLDSLLTALRISRLGRLGGLRTQRFSFAHRRFAEFFIVRKLLTLDTTIPLESIPSDSRWRDCLVVYCGIAPASEARRLAEFTWSTFSKSYADISSGDLVAARPAIHCLRFLNEAFRGRLECIDGFRDEISVLLLALLTNEDLLVSKIAAESLCLITENERETGLTTAVERGIPWISETAIRSCRHHGSISEKTQRVLRKYIGALPTTELFKRFSDLSFSLSLSEGFRRTNYALIYEVVSILIVWIVWIAAFTNALFSSFHPPAQLVTQNLGEGYQNVATMTLVSLVFLPIVFEIWLSNTSGQAATTNSKNSFKSSFIRRMNRIFELRLGLDTAVRWGLFVTIAVQLTASYLMFGTSHRTDIDKCISLFIYGIFIFNWNFCESVAEIIQLVFQPRKFIKLLSKFVKEWKENLKAIGTYLAIIAALCGTGFAIFWILTILLKIVPIEALHYFLGITTILVVLAITADVASACLSYRHDWKLLKEIDIPETLTRQWVYQMCSKLRSLWGRKKFLDALLAQSTTIVDEPHPISEMQWMNIALREKLAKLEEKWIGLEM